MYCTAILGSAIWSNAGWVAQYRGDLMAFTRDYLLVYLTLLSMSGDGCKKDLLRALALVCCTVCCKTRTIVLYEWIPLGYGALQSHIMLGYGTGMYLVVRIRTFV